MGELAIHFVPGSHSAAWIMRGWNGEPVTCAASAAAACERHLRTITTSKEAQAALARSHVGAAREGAPAPSTTDVGCPSPSVALTAAATLADELFQLPPSLE